MKKTTVDTLIKGSWADQQVTNPTKFKPSAHPTFAEADLLLIAQRNYPCYLSPAHAERGRQLAIQIRKSYGQ